MKAKAEWTRTKSAAATTDAPTNRFQRAIIQPLRSATGTLSLPNTNSSSATKGIDIASAKGHPRIAPAAKRTVVFKVRIVLFDDAGVMDDPNARLVKYIAKVDGRKAWDCE